METYWGIDIYGEHIDAEDIEVEGGDGGEDTDLDGGDGDIDLNDEDNEDNWQWFWQHCITLTYLTTTSSWGRT